MASVRFRSFALYGALVDLTLFCLSLAFFGGAHGPEGPMFMLWIVNAPVARLGSALFPFEDRALALEPLLALSEVAMNGALYGLVAAVIVAAWRRAFHKPRSI